MSNSNGMRVVISARSEARAYTIKHASLKLVGGVKSRAEGTLVTLAPPVHLPKVARMVLDVPHPRGQRSQVVRVPVTDDTLPAKRARSVAQVDPAAIRARREKARLAMKARALAQLPKPVKTRRWRKAARRVAWWVGMAAEVAAILFLSAILIGAAL